MADLSQPPTDSIDNLIPEKTISSSPPPPQPQQQEQQEQHHLHLRESDSREQHDDGDLESPPNHRERDRSPVPLPPRRDYKWRLSGTGSLRHRTEIGGTHLLTCAIGGMIMAMMVALAVHVVAMAHQIEDDRFGYDREMGGRPGYADERPHGRFAGRYQDWEGGCGGYGDTFKGMDYCRINSLSRNWKMRSMVGNMVVELKAVQNCFMLLNLCTASEAETF